jgi:hypothetical protein
VEELAATHRRCSKCRVIQLQAKFDPKHKNCIACYEKNKKRYAQKQQERLGGHGIAAEEASDALKANVQGESVEEGIRIATAAVAALL